MVNWERFFVAFIVSFLVTIVPASLIYFYFWLQNKKIDANIKGLEEEEVAELEKKLQTVKSMRETLR